ncbi:MAG: ribonuclease Z [Crocinitomicaceae bacterium]
MSFTIQILGSGSAIPTSSRGLTSQFINCAGRHYLIDCGEGTQTQMRRFGVKFQRIDAVFISHLHGDHYFGLIGLLSTMNLLGRVKPIQIFAPKELETILALQIEYNGSRMSYEIEFNATDTSKETVLIEDEKVTVSSFPLSHKVPTTGFKITQKEKQRHLLIDKAVSHGVKIEHYHQLKDGNDVTNDDGKVFASKDYTFPGEKEKTFAFCSDTKYSEGIVPSITSVDLLYHEATFTEEFIDRAKATMHSTASQAATIAKMANVGKLLMGHLSARYEDGSEHLQEAQSIFQNCEVVEDGSVYSV